MRYYQFMSKAALTLAFVLGLSMLVFTLLGEPDNGVYAGVCSLLMGALGALYGRLGKPSAWSSHAN